MLFASARSRIGRLASCQTSSRNLASSLPLCRGDEIRRIVDRSPQPTGARAALEQLLPIRLNDVVGQRRGSGLDCRVPTIRLRSARAWSGGSCCRRSAGRRRNGSAPARAVLPTPAAADDCGPLLRRASGASPHRRSVSNSVPRRSNCSSSGVLCGGSLIDGCATSETGLNSPQASAKTDKQRQPDPATCADPVVESPREIAYSDAILGIQPTVPLARQAALAATASGQRANTLPAISVCVQIASQYGTSVH